MQAPWLQLTAAQLQMRLLEEPVSWQLGQRQAPVEAAILLYFD
jgi:hypothetical protein